MGKCCFCHEELDDNYHCVGCGFDVNEALQLAERSEREKYSVEIMKNLMQLARPESFKLLPEALMKPEVKWLIETKGEVAVYKAVLRKGLIKTKYRLQDDSYQLIDAFVERSDNALSFLQLEDLRQYFKSLTDEWDRARELYDARQYEDAKQAFIFLRSSELLTLAQKYLKESQGRTDTASRQYAEFYKDLNMIYDSIDTYVGQCQYALEEYKEAEKTFRRELTEGRGDRAPIEKMLDKCTEKLGEEEIASCAYPDFLKLQGVTKSEKKHYLLHQAECGSKEEKLRYAFYLSEQRDHEEAEKWFEKATEVGTAQDQYLLGVWFSASRTGYERYVRGALRISYNIEKAKKWLLLAEEGGEKEAGKMLGDIFFREKNYTEALKRYLQAEEVDQSDASVIYKQGLVYMEIGDLGHAKECFRRAAEAGYGFAQWNTGVFCHLEKNDDEAEQWFEKSIDIFKHNVSNYLQKLQELIRFYWENNEQHRNFLKAKKCLDRYEGTKACYQSSWSRCGEPDWFLALAQSIRYYEAQCLQYGWEGLDIDLERAAQLYAGVDTEEAKKKAFQICMADPEVRLLDRSGIKGMSAGRLICSLENKVEIANIILLAAKMEDPEGLLYAMKGLDFSGETSAKEFSYNKSLVNAVYFYRYALAYAYEYFYIFTHILRDYGKDSLYNGQIHLCDFGCGSKVGSWALAYSRAKMLETQKIPDSMLEISVTNTDRVKWAIDFLDPDSDRTDAPLLEDSFASVRFVQSDITEIFLQPMLYHDCNVWMFSKILNELDDVTIAAIAENMEKSISERAQDVYYICASHSESKLPKGRENVAKLVSILNSDGSYEVEDMIIPAASLTAEGEEGAEDQKQKLVLHEKDRGGNAWYTMESDTSFGRLDPNFTRKKYISYYKSVPFFGAVDDWCQEMRDAGEDVRYPILTAKHGVFQIIKLRKKDKR